MVTRFVLAAGWIGLLAASGCASPYRSESGALAGGLAGAGTGAIIGHAVGHTGPGAAIGAALGTLTGAAIGGSLDDIEARNRAEIEARIGRPMANGAVTTPDIISMTRAGVPEDVIITHLHNNGLAQTLNTDDLIMLQREGVPPRVVQAMQQPVIRGASPGPVMYGAPPPVVMQPVYGPPPPYYYYGPPYRVCGPPAVGFGVTFRGH